MSAGSAMMPFGPTTAAMRCSTSSETGFLASSTAVSPGLLSGQAIFARGAARVIPVGSAVAVVRRGVGWRGGAAQPVVDRAPESALRDRHDRDGGDLARSVESAQHSEQIGGGLAEVP